MRRRRSRNSADSEAVTPRPGAFFNVAFLDTDSDEKFRGIGEVRLARATVGRQLVLSGAVLTTNANILALDISGLVCSGDVLVNSNFQSSGEARLLGADISRDLDFADAALLGDPVALNGRGLRVGGSLKWQPSSSTSRAPLA